MNPDRYTLLAEAIGFGVMAAVIGFGLAALLVQLSGLLDTLAHLLP